MNNETRSELLSIIAQISEQAPELRLGQLVANIATLARGADVQAVWDVEDDELLGAAQRLLTHYTNRGACVPS
jgi:hypothetical protein